MEDRLNIKIKKIQQQEEEMAAKKLAKKLGLPYLNIKITPVDASSLPIIPLKEAEESQIIAIRKFGKAIKLAAINPKNSKTKEVIEKLKKQGYNIQIFIVSGSGFKNALERYKNVKTERKQITKEVEIEPEKIVELQKEIKTFRDIEKKLKSLGVTSATEVLQIIFASALKSNASDIHFEPEEKQVRLRLRIDGILQDAAFLPLTTYNLILSRIKILSGLKINIHDVPQDGRFSIVMESQEIEIRTSIMPSAYGETIVLRILNPETIGLSLEELGLEDYQLDIINKELKRPNGMIINTGPTGSGKTTTLYAFLKKVSNPKIKVITLENPIEYHLKGIEQTQIEESEGYTFAKGLRAILRQDPDVILLGEIRDNETAETAIHAALTGHLVFTTLHTNDAAGAIPRLIDMKVNPTLIPPALNLVIAQRLVRRVCKNCAEEYRPEKAILEELKKEISSVPLEIRKKYPKIDENLTILRAGKGCEKCNLTGYKGRIAAMELFVIDDEMEKLIIKSPSIVDIREMAIKKGMVTMKQDAIFKLLNKITTIEEIERVLGA